MDAAGVRGGEAERKISKCGAGELKRRLLWEKKHQKLSKVLCFVGRYTLFFAVGGVGYALIELLWRGRTHYSMVIAGGICFIIFSLIADRLRERSLLLKAALCALAVTAVEFVFGVLFNMILGMGVWDYSNLPFNILGQICPYFTLLWGVFGYALIPLAEGLVDLLDRLSANVGEEAQEA